MILWIGNNLRELMVVRETARKFNVCLHSNSIRNEMYVVFRCQINRTQIPRRVLLSRPNSVDLW